MLRSNVSREILCMGVAWDFDGALRLSSNTPYHRVLDYRREKDRMSGFTLVESLIVVSIVGILISIAIPSLVAAQNRAKLRQAQDMVVASLQESQREATRRNQSCKLTFDKGNNKIQGQGGCLLSGDRNLPSGVSLDYTGTASSIQYGIRGNTTTNKAIILGIKDDPNPTRCLTVSAPLGIIRLGTYDNDTDSCEKLNS
jgi:prepilin-type N-terminal cleavage/methylation domain-containing protein